MKLKRQGAVALILGTACIASACGDDLRPDAKTAARADDGAPSAVCRPIKLAVIPDKSKSSPGTRTPQIKVEDLEPLVNLIGACGGELAVGVIHDRIVDPFVRLHLDPAPAEPADPQSRNVLRQRREKSRMNRIYEEQFTKWQDYSDPLVEAFLEGVKPLIEHSADADWSPVWDAVARADLFLAEAEVGSARSASRVLLLISDGVDDVRGRPGQRRQALRALKSGATVIIVNGAGTSGSLAALEPRPFESYEAATRYVENLVLVTAPPVGADGAQSHSPLQ